MEVINALRWSWMNVLDHRRATLLREKFGSLDKAIEAVSEELLKALGCRDDTILRALTRMEEFDPDAYAAELERRDVTLCSIEDDAYPRILKEIADPPVFLYGRGDWSVLDQPMIAMVGTREMSAYGKRVAEAFVAPFVHAGFVTVSGLAIGIDAAVASETIAARGRTVAVLGQGLGSIYPKTNARLAGDIVKHGGLLLCEAPLDAIPDKHTFPARNRIIAGLGVGTIVLEGGEKSGSLITADLALDYGREVFAVPGQIFDPGYAGCHRIISRGTAALVTSPEDVLNALGVITSTREATASYVPHNEQEAAVYAALTAMPQRANDLAERTQMPVGELNATLTMLELSGAARSIGGGQWVRG